MKMESLRDLFIDELKDIYNAENQLVKALPKMAKAATSSELQEAFTNHLEETEKQVERLETIFEQLGMKATGKTCKAMKGLIEEGKEIMEEDMDDDVRDAALIGAAQRVEHYEIAAYGCARTYATLLGLDDAAELLQETLDEEGAADKALTGIAEEVNVEADEGEEDEEEAEATTSGRSRRRR